MTERHLTRTTQVTCEFDANLWLVKCSHWGLVPALRDNGILVRAKGGFNTLGHKRAPRAAYDYTLQAWTVDGVLQGCSHPAQTNCNCR